MFNSIKIAMQGQTDSLEMLNMDILMHFVLILKYNFINIKLNLLICISRCDPRHKISKICACQEPNASTHEAITTQICHLINNISMQRWKHFRNIEKNKLLLEFWMQFAPINNFKNKKILYYSTASTKL